MSAQALTPAVPRRRTGRPRKREGEVPTRNRLLEAALQVFTKDGFGQASITAIAERAGISGPAVYKHFSGKAELLIEAARHSLDTMHEPGQDRSPRESARRWLAPDFAATRTLILELHVSAGRAPDVAELLSQWHAERSSAWNADYGYTPEQIKAFYLLLLGLAHIDSLSSLTADPAVVRTHVDRMVDALFDDQKRN